jgi:hypothetical protein
VNSLIQRVHNIAGLVGMENSPFGYIFSKMVGQTWDAPFTDLRIRTWRDIARYEGMVFLGAGCYDAILTIRGVTKKLSNHCWPNWKSYLTRSVLCITM